MNLSVYLNQMLMIYTDLKIHNKIIMTGNTVTYYTVTAQVPSQR